MKKKSLLDIAMSEKENISNSKLKIRKRPILPILFEIIKSIFILILYGIVFVLISIGATVLANKHMRIFFVDIIKNIC